MLWEQIFRNMFNMGTPGYIPGRQKPPGPPGDLRGNNYGLNEVLKEMLFSVFHLRVSLRRLFAFKIGSKYILGP